jgi:Berberine and berberine like
VDRSLETGSRSQTFLVGCCRFHGATTDWLPIDHIDDSVADRMLEGLNRSNSWLRLVHFRVLGGAISRVAPDATAYAHRKSAIMVLLARALEDDELAARQWTEELAASLYQGDDGAYINFFGPHDGDRIWAAYPADTLARLRRIKAAYDPTNLFSNNDNIAPHL